MNNRGFIKCQFSHKTYKLIVGGLHRDDFEWAAQQYEEVGYVLVAFILDRDGYHWKAIYVNNGEGEPNG